MLMRRMVQSVCAAALMLGVMTAQAQSPTVTRSAPPDPNRLQLVEVAAGLERPLLVTHAGDGSGRLFIVEQGGRISIHRADSAPVTFLDVSALVSRRGNEQGLLGLAFHPAYAQNGQFYINYTDVRGNTVVARYAVSSNPDAADPNSAQILMQVQQPYPNHNGGHLAFGPDGYLYIGLGDGGSAGDPQNFAQNPKSLLGKLLRIDVDGPAPYAIPADNPFVQNAAYAPEIWALGLRNPWRFSFDRVTGDLYIADVGQNAYEEVNFQPADSPGGENYGWRFMEGLHAYSGGAPAAGLTPPFAEYGHNRGCSVTGGYVYRGSDLPDLQGVYLFGDYCSGIIWTSYRDAAGTWQTSEFMRVNHAISSFGEDEAGELYLVDHGGRVLRFAPR